KDSGALPALFLIVAQLAQVSDDTLSGPGAGPNTFDEGIVRMGLALFVALIASEKHPFLLGSSMAKVKGDLQGGRFPLHRQNGLSTKQNPGNLQGKGSKIVEI